MHTGKGAGSTPQMNTDCLRPSLFSDSPSAISPSVHQPISPSAHQPISPSAHQPSVHQPSVHQPSVHQPISHQPISHQPSAISPSAHQPISHQPSAHQPSVHQSISPSVHSTKKISSSSEQCPDPKSCSSGLGSPQTRTIQPSLSRKHSLGTGKMTHFRKVLSM